MARELVTVLLASTGSVQSLITWENIEMGKKMLEFVGELPKWINYNKDLEEHVKTLRGEKEILKAVEADVQKMLQETENHQIGKKRKREVDHWLKTVKRKMVDVKKIEDEINSVVHIPRFLFRVWLGSCIAKEIQQVNELHKQGKFPEGLLLDASRDCGEPLITNVLVGKIVGEKLGEIYAHLINPKTLRIGVQGPKGIGKTAMVVEIFNYLCPFNRVYYVNVSEIDKVYSLQAAIAAEIKVDLPQPEGSERKRAASIYKALNSMKEFVLILDGLSQEFAFEDVGIPMEGNGGKLILTSQFSDVCRRMACQETVVLERLSREDSESLFMEKLAPQAALSEEVRDVAGGVIQKCDGIPSRIIDMAVQMRGVYDVNVWRCTLSEM